MQGLGKVGAVALAVVFSSLGGCSQAAAPEAQAPKAQAPKAQAPADGSGPIASASAPRAPVSYRVETVAEGLAFPWSVAFLPDGGMLVTERNGGLRRIDAQGRLEPQPVAGLPQTFAEGQGGLFEVALDPDFARNQLIYFTYAAGTERANGSRLARARLEGGALQDVQVLFEAAPLKARDGHFGGRLLFLSDGSLLMTLGEGYFYRKEAQNLANHFGSVVRLNRDGSTPKDNPFVGKEGARPEIYTYGHRNVQGVARDPESGRIYAHEHGPRGGDELNLLKPGANYGWPEITYGIDYSGAKISEYTAKPGMEQPLLYWKPSIAPSSMIFYTGTAFPAWRGDLLVSALAGQQVRRVDLEGGAIRGEQALFTELDSRIRAVAQAPDGTLILLTDEPEGRVLRVRPT